MTVNAETYAAHVSNWTKTFAASAYPYRKNWPTRCFRHEPVENAAAIINAGQLLSRRNAAGLIRRDIADAQVIATQATAHSSVRLYFRPRNPTQFHIEGIKRDGDFFNNDPRNHAPVLVIFLFSAQEILLTKGVRFSDGNMQHASTTVYSTDAEFSQLPFGGIYHVGPVSDRDIIRQRCAEVLLPSPLPLDDRLQGIVCRSPAERSTLLHMLTPEARANWANKVRVFTEPGLFEDRFLYVKSVTLSANRIDVSVKQRNDSAAHKVRIRVSAGQREFYDGTGEGATDWYSAFGEPLAPGTYLAEVWLDNCLAYQAHLQLDEGPF